MDERIPVSVETSYRSTPAELLRKIIRSFFPPRRRLMLVSHRAVASPIKQPPPMQPSVQHEGTFFVGIDGCLSFTRQLVESVYQKNQSICGSFPWNIYPSVFVRRRFTSHVRLPRRPWSSICRPPQGSPRVVCVSLLLARQTWD